MSENERRNIENKVESKIVLINKQHVIFDVDVAELYGVQTKEINQAVKNNPDKFPDGYLIQFDKEEWLRQRSKILTFESISENLKFTKYIPKAFTEKGLYMLATILKSKKATETTLAIIETYANIKELGRTINQLTDASKEKQKSLMQKGSEIIGDILDDNMETTDTETTIELNFAMLKVKHTIKKKKK